MTRRDRTTGLPLPRRGLRRRARASDGGFLASRAARFAVVGVAVAALLLVAGLLVFNWFDQSVARPRKVVLRVGAEEFTLSYYAARLPGFSRAGGGASGLLLTQELLGQLEREGLAAALAAERGVVPAEADVLEAIAASLGVAWSAGRDSPFDARYRQELRDSGMGDADYRRRAAARETARLLLESVRAETPARGELLRLRVVALASEEAARAVLERVAAGEDIGAIAQVESTDDASRQVDGILRSPPALLAAPLREALAAAAEGELLGPLEADGRFWVARLDGREADAPYTEVQIDELAALRLEEALAAARDRIPVERDFTTDDASWAIDEATGS